MAGNLNSSILYPPESAMPATEEAVAEIFDEIDVVYFMDDGFDATAYELSKMEGEEFDSIILSKEMYKLKRQLQVVSKKISVLIAKNSDQFSSQTEGYRSIELEAMGMVKEVRFIRKNLHTAHSEVLNGLSILANEKKREMLADLKESLLKIKTLYETKFRLKELVQEGDFPLAIRVCVEATNAAQAYLHFQSIKEVSQTFTQILGTMESHIDDALAALTLHYDPDKYTLVYAAYGMLDNVKGAAAKLLAFFRATIETSARTVLVDRLRRTHSIEQTDSMSYEELCEAIIIDEFIDSIRELGFVLSRCLFIYHEVLKFHIDEDDRRLCALPISETTDLDSAPIVEKGIMQKALSEGLYDIFKTASAKFNTLLCCHDLSQLKFDNFLDVVEMSNRFRKFGRKYFGNSCGEIALTLEKQTCLYFGRYHRERMDELKMFLENEVFALCPVHAQFTLFELQEFQFLKESSDAFDDDDAHVHHLTDHIGLGEQLDFILLTPDTDNPFCAPQRASVSSDKTIENGSRRGSLSRSSSEDSCLDDFVSNPQTTPNLCNTALNLLRFFGRYIRMTSLLHSVADEAITAIIQLFEYFVYSIFNFFTKDMITDHFDGTTFTALHLRRLMEAIKARLILENEANEEFKQMHNDRLPACKLSPCLDITILDTGFGLSERIIGVESVIFLKKQFEFLRPVLQSLIPQNRQLPILEKFFKDTLPVLVDMKKASFGCIASRVLDYSKLLKQIQAVNFNLNDLQDQHSNYINFIITELKQFSQKIKEISEYTYISPETNSVLWTDIIYCISRILVQGYSEATKKCTQEGRALMLLDFEHLTRELENLSTLKPIPHRAYVEEYIKAYYLPEANLEDWIAKHPEYSIAQVSSLLNATVTKRTTKSRILNVLEGN